MMPALKRVKTKYPGVYFVMGRSRTSVGKKERVYYIRYRRDGKEFEEKAGRRFQDKMTPAKAARLRMECIEGKRPPRKETRSLEVRSPLNTAASNASVAKDLNHDIKAAAKTCKDHDELESRLKASEEKFWTIFENANDLFMYVSSDGFIFNVNNKLEEIYGYRREDVIGRHYKEVGFQVFSSEAMEKISAVYQQLVTSGQARVSMELEVLCGDGTKAFVEASSIVVKEGGRTAGMLVIIKDISERKEGELKLKAAYNEMESKVKERTANLEEMNTALKVLLEKRNEDRFELEKQVLFNVEKLVMPSLEKLKKGKLAGMQKTLVDIIENNLNDIIAPFLQGRHSWDSALTPAEIQVANLIKQQKTTKEIAELLNISTSAIVFHRHNIRKKLGLVKKNVNLKSYLQYTA